MKMTFFALGRASTCARSRRSAVIVSMPQPSSRSRSSGSLKRATPMMRFPGAAARARRASVGPILPPTPRMMMSPSTRAISAMRAALGRERKSSSWSVSAKPDGSEAAGSDTEAAVRPVATFMRQPQKTLPCVSRLARLKFTFNHLVEKISCGLFILRFTDQPAQLFQGVARRSHRRRKVRLDSDRPLVAVGNEGPDLSAPVDVAIGEQGPGAVGEAPRILEVDVADMRPDGGVAVGVGHVAVDQRVRRVPVDAGRRAADAFYECGRPCACIGPVAFLR